jgi:hypothetical protein
MVKFQNQDFSDLIRNQGNFAKYVAEFLTGGPEMFVEPEVIEQMVRIFDRQLSRLSRIGSTRRNFSLKGSTGDYQKDLEEFRKK